MNGGELSTEDVALMRLSGGLLIASGLLIAALCGGCTLNVLRQSGNMAVAPIALAFGGGPVGGGLLLAGLGFRQLRRAASATPLEGVGSMPELGWAFVGVGAVVALTATYQIVWDVWVLLNAMNGTINALGGTPIAFFAALEHAVLFAIAAGVVECGRRIMR
jgi:hypothetical protein